MVSPDFSAGALLMSDKWKDVVVWLVCLIPLAMIGTVIYVAVHFILKFW